VLTSTFALIALEDPGGKRWTIQASETGQVLMWEDGALESLPLVLTHELQLRYDFIREEKERNPKAAKDY
jgi:hypothetical protein